MALGLLDEAQVKACAGTPPLNGAPGIHLGSAVHFTEGLKAGRLEQDGGEFLAVRGDAAPYRFMLRVLSGGGTTRGLH